MSVISLDDVARFKQGGPSESCLERKCMCDYTWPPHIDLECRQQVK